MKRTRLALIPALALLGSAGGCMPTCTCPAVTPAAAPAPGTPGTPGVPQPMPAAAPRIANAGQVARRMRSVYPELLFASGVRGDVVVELTVNAQGGVESAADVEATDDRFRAAAVAVAQEIRFTPPIAEGTTVRVRMRFQTAGSRVDVLP